MRRPTELERQGNNIALSAVRADPISWCCRWTRTTTESANGRIRWARCRCGVGVTDVYALQRRAFSGPDGFPFAWDDWPACDVCQVRLPWDEQADHACWEKEHEGD